MRSYDIADKLRNTLNYIANLCTLLSQCCFDIYLADNVHRLNYKVGKLENAQQSEFTKKRS